MFRFACYLIFIFMLSSVGHAQGMTEEKMIEEISKLNWQIGEGIHELIKAKSNISTQEDEAFLEGEDAHKFMKISEGHDAFKPDALIVKLSGPMAESGVVFNFFEDGYVKMDDWEDHIDPSSILDDIKRGTKEANKIKAKGYPKLYVDGWVEEPYLDREKAVVYWAIKGHDDAGNMFVNAKVLKLGRKGYTSIVWMGAPAQFKNAAQTLTPALGAYRYQEGMRYADYIPDVDTVAAVGVGAITYKLLTGNNKFTKAAGAGILAIILAFAKKLWFLIFIPIIALWRLAKSAIFGKKEEN